MTLTGADPAALDALASAMVRAAEELEGARQMVRSLLYTVDWHGEDAESFRGDWDGPHSARLNAAVAVLRQAADVVRRNAGEQRAASGLSEAGSPSGVAGPGSAGAGPGGLDLDPLARGVDILGLGVGLAAAGYGAAFDGLRFTKGYGVEVSGYMRQNGTWVDGYARWRPGTADDLNGFVGSAEDASRWAKGAEWAGHGLSVVGAGFAAYGQYEKDKDKGYSDTELGMRTAGAGVANFAFNEGAAWAGAEAGAAIGTCVGGPVGTVAGAVIGAGIGWTVSALGSDVASEVGAEIGSGIYDAGVAAFTFGGDAVGALGDFAGSVGDLAGEAGDAVGGFIDDITPW